MLTYFKTVTAQNNKSNFKVLPTTAIVVRIVTEIYILENSEELIYKELNTIWIESWDLPTRTRLLYSNV